MARNGRKRLSWFKFYPDDFRGGVNLIPPRYLGQYLLALCAQWDSKTVQAIPNDPESLRLIFHGEKPHQRVLEKFDEIVVGSQKMLRNQRLADEWNDAEREYEGKSRGGGRKTDSAPVSVPDTGADDAPTRARNQNQNHIRTERESPVGSYIESPEAKRIWVDVLGQTAETVPEHNFATWLRPTWAMGLDPTNDAGVALVVGVPSEDHRAQIWQFYGARLRGALEKAAPGMQLRLVVSEGGS